MAGIASRVASSDAFVVTDAAYRPRNPEDNPVYGVVTGQLETFLARQRERDRHVPAFVEREFRELGSAAIYDEEPRQVRSSKAFGKSSFA